MDGSTLPFWTKAPLHLFRHAHIIYSTIHGAICCVGTVVRRKIIVGTQKLRRRRKPHGQQARQTWYCHLGQLTPFPQPMRSMDPCAVWPFGTPDVQGVLPLIINPRSTSVAPIDSYTSFIALLAWTPHNQRSCAARTRDENCQHGKYTRKH